MTEANQIDSEFNLQTEVRLADLLPLLADQICQPYMCHYVAYMLQDEIAKHPLYQEFHDLNFYNLADEDYFRMRNNAIPYYFLVQEPSDASANMRRIKHQYLDEQVISQFNGMMLKHRPDLNRVVTGYHLCSISMSMFWKGPYDQNGYCLDSWRNRYEMVKKLVELDPDAVLTIRL